MPIRLDRITGRFGKEPLGLVAVAPGSVLLQYSHVTGDNTTFIVGDSHTLICGAQFAYPDCDVDARPGRGSEVALEILRTYLRPHHRVIVFEIATNDIMWPPGYAANLEQLEALAEDRQIVLVNTWRRDGVNTHAEVNAALDAFHAAHPDKTVLVDWAAYVDRHRRAIGKSPDYVHFSRSAYEARIKLVTAAIVEARARSGAPRA